jgi:hypothetical protein
VSPTSVTGTALSGTPTAALAKNPSTTMAPAGQHDTEITLDDALEVLEKLTEAGFSTYEKSAELAAEAAQVRIALEELAVDLRERHNVAGNITATAMELLAESMDVLVEKSAVMQIRALHAAELAELADQQMNDAYKPVQQATADAGLATPSARIHNES